MLKFFFRFPFWIAVLVFAASGGFRSAAAQVTVTDIGTINGRSSIGFAVNHAGDVAGFSVFTGSPGTSTGGPPGILLEHAVLYNGSVLQDLGAIEGMQGCSSEGCESEALAVNDSNWVAGWTQGLPQGTIPFLWLPSAAPGGHAGFNILPGLSQFHTSEPQGINNSGQIVGYSFLNGGTVRAILWQLLPSGPVLTDLGTLRADKQGSAVALAINDLGQIVGYAAPENFVQQAFLYLPSAAYGLPAGMNNLTPNQTFGAAATKINNRGEVVGVVASGAPFIWLPAPAYGLPAGLSILPLPSGYIGFTPSGIADGGQVVGVFSQVDPKTGVFKQVAGGWKNNRWFFLNDLIPPNSGWDLQLPEAVTVTGRNGKTTLITGSGALLRVTDVTGQKPAGHGFLLTISCTGDLDDNGVVDQKDMQMLVAQLGQQVPPGTGADLNGDGVVNLQDLLILTKQRQITCF